MTPTTGVNSPDPLSQCRQDIDRIDGVLVALLRERTRLAMQAGEIKLATGEPVHAAAREAAVLQRVQALAVPPHAAEAIVRIFSCIIDEARNAELTTRA